MTFLSTGFVRRKKKKASEPITPTETRRKRYFLLIFLFFLLLLFPDAAILKSILSNRMIFLNGIDQRNAEFGMGNAELKEVRMEGKKGF